MEIKVLSLFDGISCARVALERAGIPVEEYVASEIDPYAMTIAQRRYPDTFGVGSVVGLMKSGWIDTSEGYFDLLIGGSPCQDLSIAKKGREGLAGKRSGLFYEFVKIKDTLKPKWFILENVNSMPKEAKNEISRLMGVEPIMINATLVSAQNRKRLFWTNIPNVVQPEDRGIMLKDILEDNPDIAPEKSRTIRTSGRSSGEKDKHNWDTIRIGKIGKGGQGDRIYSPQGKSTTPSANGGGRGAKTGLYLIQTPRGNNKGGMKALNGKTPSLTSSSWEHNNKLVVKSASSRGRNLINGNRKDILGAKTKQRIEVGGDKANAITSVFRDSMVSVNDIVRKLTPIECERLQGLPDNYTKGISDSQRYKCLGNAFNVDVVAHILTFVKKHNETTKK